MMATTTQSDGLATKRLCEIATPDLYQVNAFRVLGLPVDASRSAVRKREKRLRRSERLGMNGSAKSGYMPLADALDSDDVRQAMHRLQDPLSRLFDEFFWFWPTESGKKDDALALLAAGRLQRAHKLWLSRESAGTQDFVSTHNLAVLYHVMALDFERKVAVEPLSDKDEQTRLGAWQRAFKRWHILVNQDSLWHRVRERIRELDDPQLSMEMAHDIRHGLSEVILLINARLAVKAAEQDRRDLASQHIQIMRKSRFEQSLINDALRECLRPLRLRLTGICESAEPRADTAPRKANKVTRKLLKDAWPLLKTFNMMLPDGDAMREGVHDEVARTALRCQITFANATEDWKESSAILTAVLNNLRPSTSMRGRIQENHDTVANNLKWNTCYFCGERLASSECAVKKPMYGNVRKSPAGFQRYRITWQQAEVAIPRCKECKEQHSKKEETDGTVGGIGCFAFLVCLGLCLWLGTGWGAGLFFAVVAAGCAAWVTYLFVAPDTPEHPVITKSLSSADEFERIKELKKQGWKYGTEPSQFEQQNAPTDPLGALEEIRRKLGL